MRTRRFAFKPPPKPPRKMREKAKKEIPGREQVATELRAEFDKVELRVKFDQLQQRVEAAEEENQFFRGCLQMHSPKMDGQHSWRFHGGWPITSARGSTPGEAIQHAMQLIQDAKAAAEAAKVTT